MSWREPRESGTRQNEERSTELLAKEATVASRVAPILLAALLLTSLAGCGSPDDVSPDVDSEPPASDGGASGGTQLAPGLYDLADGTVQAVGTLEWRDLEGGFWVITGGTEAEGTTGETVAVIANGADLESTLAPLKGLTVLATGTRFEGASIRMAGPEIIVETIEEISGAGPAE